MLKTTHVRADIADVVPALERTLAAEGFRRSSATLAPRTVLLGGQTVTFPPEVPPHLRRLVVAERDGWVAIADDPFSPTDWGKALSDALADAVVFTLEGECDHAFYSTILVHKNGAVAHKSEVPKDSVREADGRYRIRPLLLGEHFPDAKAAIEAGIVVSKLGGEANIRAVAEALSLPNALVSPYDEEGDGRVAHLFELDAERAAEQSTPDRHDDMLGGVLADVFANMAKDIDEESLAALGVSPGLSDPSLIAKEMMAHLTAMAAQQTTPKDEPLTLQSPGSSRWSGFAGNEHECHTTLQLGNGEANGPRCSRGLRIRVTGSGLDSFEVTKIRVVPTGSVGDPAAPQWELAPERAADGVFADAPDVELVLPSSDPTSAVLPPGERLRRRAHTPVFAAMAADRAGVVVYVSGVLLREGKGAIEIHAETTAADGATLTTTSKNSLEVRAALRAPILPEWVDDARLRANRSVLAEYEAREVAVGWLGFDRAWPDVRGVIAQMLGQLSALLVEIARSEPKREQVVLGGRAPSSEILAALKRGADVIIRGRSDMRAMLDDTDGESICLSSIEGEPSSEDGFAADVLRKGGERLDFQAPVAVGDTDAAWTKILAELDRGAQVSLRAGRYGSAFRIEVAHQPEGSNYFPDPSQAERYARVQIGWSCPRPVRSASALLLTRVGSDLLACAGEIEGNLGGVLLAQGRMFDLATFTTTYESLVDTRMRAGDPKWLASHVRSPGHRVLVPAGAATKLVASPGVEQRMLAHAVLLSARGDDPFTAEREPMERAVLPLVGSREDIVT